jgi:hypothetical protein
MIVWALLYFIILYTYVHACIYLYIVQPQSELALVSQRSLPYCATVPTKYPRVPRDSGYTYMHVWQIGLPC